MKKIIVATVGDGVSLHMVDTWAAAYQFELSVIFSELSEVEREEPQRLIDFSRETGDEKIQKELKILMKIMAKYLKCLKMCNCLWKGLKKNLDQI